MYTGNDDLRVRPLARPLPQMHTTNRPIFKIFFDSENLEKLTRDSVAISLIFALEDPLNCYHIFWI